MAESEAVEVWPDTWPAVQLFIDCLTQWRQAMAGITGIDYCALDAVMRIRRVPRDERASLFDDVRIMEAAVIEHMRGKK